MVLLDVERQGGKRKEWERAVNHYESPACSCSPAATGLVLMAFYCALCFHVIESQVCLLMFALPYELGSGWNIVEVGIQYRIS